MYQITVREFQEQLSRFSPDARMSVVFADGCECVDFKVDGPSPATDCQIQCSKDEGSTERIKELDEENDELAMKCKDSFEDLEEASAALTDCISKNPNFEALKDIQSSVESAMKRIDL